jgi:hypothetical protein
LTQNHTLNPLTGCPVKSNPSNAAKIPQCSIRTMTGGEIHRGVGVRTPLVLLA